jgi:hypothetical protein
VNTEERRLSELLHETTPVPPRLVTVEDVAARLARRSAVARRQPPGRWPWVPLLAAASVTLIAVTAAVTAAILRADNRSARPHITTSPAVRIHAPWRARLLGPKPVMGSLISAGNALYGFIPPWIVRIDPATGAVAARTKYDSLWLPFVATNALWIPSVPAGNGRAPVVLHRFDLTTLQPLPPVSVRLSGVNGRSKGAAITVAGHSAHSLFVGAGNTVAVLDPVTRRVVRRIHVSGGQVVALAVAPDGTRLYVGVTANGDSELQVRNPVTGALLAQPVPMGLPGRGILGLFVATAGGVWATTGSGMEETVFFTPASDLGHQRTVGTGGGGLVISTSVGGGAVWVGGPDRISCADPVTGHIRASAAVPARYGSKASLGSVAYVHGQAFAIYYSAAQSGLVRIYPPRVCTR